MAGRGFCFFCFFGFFFNLAVEAEEFTVSIASNQFKPAEIHIHTRDTLLFINQDRSDHNIFSLSDTKIFDLGVFSPGEQKGLDFSPAEVGAIEVRCALNDSMIMMIYIEKN